MIDRYWEVFGWGITLLAALLVALFTDKQAIYLSFFILSGIFLGIWIGKMIYAEDAVAHPGAFKSLSEAEITKRRKKR